MKPTGATFNSNYSYVLGGRACAKMCVTRSHEERLFLPILDILVNLVNLQTWGGKHLHILPSKRGCQLWLLMY